MIHLEICKGKYENLELWSVRDGTIDGSTEFSNIDKGELLRFINGRIQEEEYAADKQSKKRTNRADSGQDNTI